MRYRIRKERIEGTTFWYIYEGDHAVYESTRKHDVVKYLEELTR